MIGIVALVATTSSSVAPRSSALTDRNWPSSTPGLRSSIAFTPTDSGLESLSLTPS